MIDAIAAYAVEVAPPGAPIGVSVAGTVTADGRLTLGSHVEWGSVPFSAGLARVYSGPVRVINDGDATARGELLCRPAAVTPLLAVCAGTSLGGGLVTSTGSYTGAQAMGLEIGHVIVEPSGRRCRCGGDGCLQAYASGWAVGERYAEERRVTGPLDARAVVRAARDGDTIAAAVLTETGAWLGLGLATLVAVLDPALIVPTGGLVEAGEMPLGPARRTFTERVFARAQRDVAWELSGCDGAGALIGAAAAAGGWPC